MPGILVVEDDENLNRGITFSLKKSGYEVFSAESVKKAKRIASDNNVDVTICDVNLPDGNGLEFVRWMRCNYNTYIICLTAASLLSVQFSIRRLRNATSRINTAFFVTYKQITPHRIWYNRVD